MISLNIRINYISFDSITKNHEAFQVKMINNKDKMISKKLLPTDLNDINSNDENR